MAYNLSGDYLALVRDRASAVFSRGTAGLTVIDPQVGPVTARR